MNPEESRSISCSRTTGVPEVGVITISIRYLSTKPDITKLHEALAGLVNQMIIDEEMNNKNDSYYPLVISDTKLTIPKYMEPTVG